MFGVLKGEKFLLMLKAGLISDISSSGTAGGGHVARLLHRLPLRHQAQRRGGPGSGGPRDVQGQRGHRDHRGLPDSRGPQGEAGACGGGEPETGGAGGQSLAALPLTLPLAGHGQADLLWWPREQQEQLQAQRPVRRLPDQPPGLEVLHMPPHWISPRVSGDEATWNCSWSLLGRLCQIRFIWLMMTTKKNEKVNICVWKENKENHKLLSVWLNS